MQIPRVIHNYWSNFDGTPSVPDDVASAMARTQAVFSSYAARLWDRAAISALLETLEPSYSALFDRLTIPAMQSDIARLAVLYKFGGLYIDVAIVPQSSASSEGLESLIGQSSIVVAESMDNSAQLMNRLILATQQHPLMLDVLTQACANVQESMDRGDTQVDVWELTGSVLSKTINERQDQIPSLLRLDFATAHTLFTRVDCEYKHTYTGNWSNLQSGNRYPIYES